MKGFTRKENQYGLLLKREDTMFFFLNFKSTLPLKSIHIPYKLNTSLTIKYGRHKFLIHTQGLFFYNNFRHCILLWLIWVQRANARWSQNNIINTLTLPDNLMSNPHNSWPGNNYSNLYILSKRAQVLLKVTLIKALQKVL